jgi:5,10-methylenetetrahydromethanopterin reductase
MRIAIHSAAAMRGTVDQVVDEVRKVAQFGLAGYWAPMLNGYDTLTALAIAGREIRGVEWGTTVAPMPLRSPFALAPQVAIVQEVVGGRPVVGLGPSHEALVRDKFGLDWAPPLAMTRQYVRKLLQIMSRAGRQRVAVGADRTTPVLLGANNPAMTVLAAELTSGIVTWAAGTKTVMEVLQPAVQN